MVLRAAPPPPTAAPEQRLLEAVLSQNPVAVKRAAAEGLKAELYRHTGARCPLALAVAPGQRVPAVVAALLDAGCPPAGLLRFPPPLALALDGEAEAVEAEVVRLLLVAGAAPDAVADYDGASSGTYPDPPGPGDPVWERALATGRPDLVALFFEGPVGAEQHPSDHAVFQALFALMGSRRPGREHPTYRTPITTPLVALDAVADDLMARGFDPFAASALEGGSAWDHWFAQEPQAATEWRAALLDAHLPAATRKPPSRRL